MCCLNVLPMFCPSVLPSVLPIVVHSGIEDGEATTVGSPTEGSPGLPGGRRTRVHDDGATCSQLVVGRGFIVAATTTRRRRGDDDDDHDEAATTSALTVAAAPDALTVDAALQATVAAGSRSLQPPRPSQSLQPPGSRCSTHRSPEPLSLPGAQPLQLPRPHPHTGLPLTDLRGW